MTSGCDAMFLGGHNLVLQTLHANNRNMLSSHICRLTWEHYCHDPCKAHGMAENWTVHVQCRTLVTFSLCWLSG